MKRFLEFEKGDNPKDLTRDEALNVVKALLLRTYSVGVGTLLFDILQRENDTTKIGEMIDELFALAAKKGLTDTVRIEYGSPPQMVPQSSLPRTTKQVPSDSRIGHVHTLTFENGRAVECTCESFHFNSEHGNFSCKHIRRENS